jgi:molecular chaperone GrpE
MTDPVTNEDELSSGGAVRGEGDVGVAADAGTSEGDSEGEATTSGPGAPDGSALGAKLEALNDKHLRLVAEFNNYRRRNEQERLNAWARAQGDLLAKFLEVLDDLNRVADLDLSNATVEAIMEGVDLVERKFLRILEDAGVEIIDPIGEPFDPSSMEGVMRMPAEREEQDETVALVMQKGYALKGSLIRPARVAVFKHG